MLNRSGHTPQEHEVVDAVRGLIGSAWARDSKLKKLREARSAFQNARRGCPPRAAVSGFNMSINAAGRAHALADIYACSYDTTLIGFLHHRFGGELWSPLRSSRHPFKGISIDKASGLPQAAMQFVLENPFEIVHLSKPRFPNVLLGVLYEVVWGAKVFMDVDDEDLGVLQERQEPLPFDEFLSKYPKGKRRWRKLLADEGTRVGVGLWDIFDGVTVSNPALQQRYGGLVLPHARLATHFQPSAERKKLARREFDIPDDAIVFLFFGTARQHKGLVETAQALAEVNHPESMYVVAGDIPDEHLREELLSVKGANTKLLPSQPFDRVPDIVGLADACVLLQDEASLLAQFQLPAKLVDALAMGLMVFITPTPAVRNIIDAGAALPVSPDNLAHEMNGYLSSLNQYASIRSTGRSLFLEQLSVEACSPLLDGFIAQASIGATSQIASGADKSTTVFNQIGGWPEFSPNKFLRYFR